MVQKQRPECGRSSNGWMSSPDRCRAGGRVLAQRKVRRGGSSHIVITFLFPTVMEWAADTVLR